MSGWRQEKTRNTTRLPAALREELGLEQDTPKRGHRGLGKPATNSILARKLARKEQRQAKRRPPAPGPSRPPQQEQPSKRPRIAPQEERGAYKHKAARLEHAPAPPRAAAPAPSEKAERRTKVDPFTGAVREEHAPALKKRSALESLVQQSAKSEPAKPKAPPRSKMTDAERREEDEIAWLEYQLYGRKGKRKGGEEEDDLDFLLDDMDRFQAGMYDDDGRKGKDHGDTEDEDDLAKELEGGDMDSEDEDKGLVDPDEEDDDEGQDDEEDEEEDEEEEEEEADDEVEDGEDKGQEDTLEDNGEGHIEHGDHEKNAKEPGPRNGALEAAPAPSSSRYIPPALRQKLAEKASGDSSGISSVEEQKLRRHVNGLLNRLGENNIDTIVGELDSLYRSYSRHDVTAMLTRLALDTITAQANLSEPFVLLYATLVTAMHKVVGVEFGAYFLQACIDRLLVPYSRVVPRLLSLSPEQALNDDTCSTGSRECANLVQLLCQLFNLKLLAAGIMYDLVRLLLGSEFTEMAKGVSADKPLTELDIELLLRIVRTSGAQLRQDDPKSLQAIVELTTRRVDAARDSGTQGVAASSRARFMLEAVTGLRQSRKRAPANSADPAQRMLRYLGALERRRTVRAHSSIQVGLRDLQDAERRGRWWLVGAAWTGREAVPAERTESAPEAVPDTPLHDDIQDTGTDVSTLARTQGMNTEARRAVFTTLMDSQDFEHAVQSLLALQLNDTQRREIVRVLVHCLGQEAVYNPYYVLIGQRLAQDLIEMRVTLQYVLWDFFRELGEKHVGGESVVASNGQDEDGGDVLDKWLGDATRARRLLHLARAYGWWIAKDALSLGALRTVDFTSLHATGTYFLQHLFINMLLATQMRSPMLTDKVRARLAQSPSASDRQAIEVLVVRGTTGNTALAQGIYVFLQSHLRRSNIVALLGKSGVQERLGWAVGVATQAASVGTTEAEE